LRFCTGHRITVLASQAARWDSDHVQDCDVQGRGPHICSLAFTKTDTIALCEVF